MTLVIGAMKRALKRLVYLLFAVLVVPIWLLYMLQAAIFGRKRSFYDYSQLMSLIPGIVGNYFRFAFYRLTIASLGDDSCICFGATLADPKISIGRGVYIGPYCNLGLCTIGDDVLLATEVHIISGFSQHGHSDLSVPINRMSGSAPLGGRLSLAPPTETLSPASSPLRRHLDAHFASAG